MFIALIYFFYPYVMISSFVQITRLTASSETKEKTLEEIAAAFGDQVVEVDDQEVVSEALAVDGKADTKHVENR